VGDEEDEEDLLIIFYSGMVWCGVVWCGVVWCGVVWCGVVCGGMVWYDVVSIVTLLLLYGIVTINFILDLKNPFL